MVQSHLYIGLMSGTSADAVDAALVDLSGFPQLLATHSSKLDSRLREDILNLCQSESDAIDLLGHLDVELGRLFAQCALDLLEKAGRKPDEIRAIGSHGQTIRHRPPGADLGRNPFTLQIGDPNTIAYLTGVTTIADFRRKDIAAGGQGAPLVPAFHKAIFHSESQARLIINLGGMANITWLPTQGRVRGYDTGPANVLMDAWIDRHLQQSFDENGNWAASSEPDTALVARLIAHPYFAQVAPKSTGREIFNLNWLEREINALGRQLHPAQVQSSLLQLTVNSLALEISGLAEKGTEIIVCGGGAYNGELNRRLALALPGYSLLTSSDLGIDPQWIEAMAFAWLAQQTLNRATGNLCDVTGASREVILGGIYLAD